MPDASGALTGLGTTSTVDTDGDGKADTFQVPIQVTVSAPGIWYITLDPSQDGELVLSARGTANLPAGPGVIDVDVRREELLFMGADGVFEATNVALSEWTDESPRLAARVDSRGRTGPFRLRDIALPRPTQG